MIALLNLRMADILDLHYQTLLAHWNVRGPNFIGLHTFFDDFAGCNGADNWCDWVAERIGQLGGVVVTSVQFIASHSTLTEYKTNTVTGEDHVRQLARALSEVIVTFRDAAQLAETKQDHVTCDILRQVQRSGEKYLWMLEAHLQS
jgi:starvation-inducible DNA-binding protein